jgi:hypothetical protein
MFALSCTYTTGYLYSFEVYTGKENVDGYLLAARPVSSASRDSPMVLTIGDGKDAFQPEMPQMKPAPAMNE